MRRLLSFLLLVLLLAVNSPVEATILFAGNEDADFTRAGTCATNCNVTTTTTRFRAAYSRAPIVLNSQSSTDPNPYRWISPTFTNTGTLWLHFQYGNVDGTATVSGGQMVVVYASDGNPAILVRGTGTAGQVKLSKRSTGGTFTDLATCTSGALPTIGVTQVDLFINYAVSGQATLYVNSASICTFSGDVTTDSRTQLNQIAYGAMTNTTDTYSETIAADADTRAMALVTMEPASAGNATAWTGTNPCTAIVNSTTFNDGTFISSATNNQLNQCGVKFGNANTTFPSGSFSVNAVVTSFRGQRGASGPQHIEHNLRTGSVDSNSSDVTVTTSFANYYNVWATNPNGGGAWAVSDLTAAGFNIGVKSTP